MPIALIIGKVWPEPNSTAAGWRTLDLFGVLSKMGYACHFACAAQPNEHCADLNEQAVQTHSIGLNSDSFDEWIEKLDPEIVVFDRYMTEEQFGWRVSKSCPNALRILDTSDLHCLREARRESVEKDRALNLYNKIALREVASIYRSDLTLMISKAEIEILLSSFSIHPSSLLTYFPFTVDLKNTRTEPLFEDRKHCTMIGSFMHPPNVDSVKWCISKIWPQVRKALSGVELHIYGSYSDKFVASFKEKDGVILKGRAENVSETLMRYRLNLAPLRYGAGLKGKVLDGFISGTPTVVTPVAAEGICKVDTFMGMVSDKPEAIAREIIDLYLNREKWAQCQQQGTAILRDKFDQEEHFARLTEAIQEAKEQKQNRRNQNFVGQMLRHHNHASTEYMSRWIQAKNAN